MISLDVNGWLAINILVKFLCGEAYRKHFIFDLCVVFFC